MTMKEPEIIELKTKKPEKMDLKAGDPPQEVKEVPIEYSNRIGKAKINLIVFNGSEHYMVSCKVKGDHWLHFRGSSGKKRKIIIAHNPATFLIKKRVGYKKYLVWYAGERAEVTHDPAATQYDLPVVENIIKGITAITDSEIPKVLAEEVKSSKKWTEYIPWILFFLTNVAWMVYTNEIVKNVVPKPPAIGDILIWL